MSGGRGDGGFSMGSDDTALLYTDDAYSSYQNIFDNAKTDVTDSDKDRLIASLKQLNAQENLEEVVDVEEVIRYFVVHNFVCNFDSYTGSMIHNYYLYEEDGQLSMIPWDYNLAFGGFLGSSDATALVNYPIDTPVSGGTVDSGPCSPGFSPARSTPGCTTSISPSSWRSGWTAAPLPRLSSRWWT